MTESRRRAVEAGPLPPDGTSALALRAAAVAGGGTVGGGFLARRLRDEVHGLPSGGERSALSHLTCVLEDADLGSGAVADALILYAGVLEKWGRLDEAEAAVTEAATLAPGAVAVTLHAARIARKRGDRDRARALYRSVRRKSGESGGLARMARVGEAMLAPEPAVPLGAVLREAVEAGDREGAAVAQEERARAHRGAGRRDRALRDYLVAAARFPDPVDRARVLHEAADMLTARGDLLGARELLLVGLREGRAEQRAHAVGRLHALSRTLGDELGRRRWSGGQPAPLVSLTPRRSSGSETVAPRLASWLRRLGLAGAGAEELSTGTALAAELR